MRKCTNPGCPCVCDDPSTHHKLARLDGSMEVDPSYCARAEPTVPASEHQRVQAEAAAMRRALEHIQTALDTRYGEHPIGRSELRGATDSALLGSAGRALLEEVEGLRRKVRSLENDVDALNRTCCELNEDLKKAEEKARLGWERAAEKDRAYGEALCERDEAREDAALARDGVVPQRLPYLSSPAEVRRAVEEAVERCAVVASRTPCPKGHSATSTGYMAKLIAAAIRARGKGPEK